MKNSTANSTAKKTKTVSRDYSKYTFQGEKYGKGNLVLAVVREYVKKHPEVTIKELKKEIFPKKEVHSGFEVVESVNKAPKGRFFLNDEDIIKVGNTRAAITSQWSTDNIVSFIEYVRKKLKMKIYTHHLAA